MLRNYSRQTNFIVPENVEVSEITGPLFFGAAYKFKDAMRFIESAPRVLNKNEAGPHL